MRRPRGPGLLFGHGLMTQYKERTEAGLVDLCDSAEDEAFETLHYRLGKRGLWRDPPQAEVKP